jgi:hypothetical protein
VISLVAGIIKRLEEKPAGRGRPRLPVADVVETLRFFLCQGIQPLIRRIGSGFGVPRSVVENANA